MIIILPFKKVDNVKGRQYTKNQETKGLGVDVSMREKDVDIQVAAEPTVQELRERSYEFGLPDYLQHDLDAYKEGLEKGSSLLDCLWGELYGSINTAELSAGAITPEHADYLRKKFLWGGQENGRN